MGSKEFWGSDHTSARYLCRHVRRHIGSNCWKLQSVPHRGTMPNVGHDRIYGSRKSSTTHGRPTYMQQEPARDSYSLALQPAAGSESLVQYQPGVFLHTPDAASGLPVGGGNTYHHCNFFIGVPNDAAAIRALGGIHQGPLEQGPVFSPALGDTAHMPAVPVALPRQLPGGTQGGYDAQEGPTRVQVPPHWVQNTQTAPVASQGGLNTQATPAIVEAPVASQGDEITQAAQAPVEAPAANPAPQSEQATGSAGTGKTSSFWYKCIRGLFWVVVAVGLVAGICYACQEGISLWNRHQENWNVLLKKVQELSAELEQYKCNASTHGNDTAPTPSPTPSPVPPTHSPTPQPLPKEDAKTPTSKQGAESPVSHMPHGNTTIQTNNSSCTFFYPCQSSQVQSGNQSVSNNTTPLTGKPSADPAPEQAKQGMNPTQKLDWVPLGCNLTNWENPLHNGTPCSDLIPKNVTVDDCLGVCEYGDPAEGPKKCCPCARLKAVCIRR